MYFNSALVVYYINRNIPLTYEYETHYVNVYSVLLTRCTCKCLHKLVKLRNVSVQSHYIFAAKQHMKEK
jgi:hypothetical protein